MSTTADCFFSVPVVPQPKIETAEAYAESGFPVCVREWQRIIVQESETA